MEERRKKNKAVKRVNRYHQNNAIKLSEEKKIREQVEKDDL